MGNDKTGTCINRWHRQPWVNSQMLQSNSKSLRSHHIWIWDLASSVISTDKKDSEFDLCCFVAHRHQILTLSRFTTFFFLKLPCFSTTESRASLYHLVGVPSTIYLLFYTPAAGWHCITSSLTSWPEVCHQFQQRDTPFLRCFAFPHPCSLMPKSPCATPQILPSKRRTKRQSCRRNVDSLTGTSEGLRSTEVHGEHQTSHKCVDKVSGLHPEQYLGWESAELW